LVRQEAWVVAQAASAFGWPLARREPCIDRCCLKDGKVWRSLRAAWLRAQSGIRPQVV